VLIEPDPEQAEDELLERRVPLDDVAEAAAEHEVVFGVGAAKGDRRQVVERSVPGLPIILWGYQPVEIIGS
jgi:hypothetical protein